MADTMKKTPRTDCRPHTPKDEAAHVEQLRQDAIAQAVARATFADWRS